MDGQVREIHWCGYCGKQQNCTFEEFMFHLDFCETELARRIRIERDAGTGKGLEGGVE